MKIDAKGIALIKEFEGCRLTAYKCVAGVWTIGWGFTKGVKEGDVITQSQADARLFLEIKQYEKAVDVATKGTCNQNQFSALVSFAWNVGVAGMAGSSVIKALNRGDTKAAARAFGLWDKAGGKVFAGLTRRRAAEAALFLEPISDDVSDPVEGAVLPMPQKVDTETPLTASPINKASVVAGATAAIASASEVVGAVNNFRRGFADLSDWAIPVLLVATVAAAGFVIWQRWQQRRLGWA
jgi:lysozyme